MDRLEPRPALLAWAQARQRSPRGPVRARLNTFDPPTLANLAPRILRAIARAQTLPPIRDVIDALRLIPNDDVGWDEWSTMGMTVFAATDGCEQGREAFDSWSRKSKKHNRADVEERWDHWHRSPPTELSYGSLRHRAKAVDPSWEPPSRQPGCGLHRDKDS